LDDSGKPDIRKITFLDGEVVDSPVVAKVLHQEVYEFKTWWAVERSSGRPVPSWGSEEFSRIANEFSTQVLERIQQTQQMLEKDGILHLPIVEFHPEAAQPYMVQMKFPPNSADFRMFNASEFFKNGKRLSYEDASGLFTPEMQEAYVQMIQKFTKNDHIPLDLSLGNVFFKRANGKWEAGVVDIDLVMEAKNPQGFPADFAEEIRVLRADQVFSRLGENPRVWKAKPDGSWDAEIFNEKMFEYPYPGNGATPFIRFNPTMDDFEKVLIDPAIVRKYFPQLRAPKVLKKSSYAMPWPRPFREFRFEAAA